VLHSSKSKGGRREWTAVRARAVSKTLLRAIERGGMVKGKGVRNLWGVGEQLKASAQEVGLDVAAFEQCFSSGTYQATVQQDVDEGTRAGVTGTPAFFINGRLVSGAQPLERFTRVIEGELARVR